MTCLELPQLLTLSCSSNAVDEPIITPAYPCVGSLANQQFVGKDDGLYCPDCYDTNFAQRCDVCNKTFKHGKPRGIRLSSHSSACSYIGVPSSHLCHHVPRGVFLHLLSVTVTVSLLQSHCNVTVIWHLPFNHRYAEV